MYFVGPRCSHSSAPPPFGSSASRPSTPPRRPARTDLSPCNLPRSEIPHLNTWITLASAGAVRSITGQGRWGFRDFPHLNGGEGESQWQPPNPAHVFILVVIESPHVVPLERPERN